MLVSLTPHEQIFFHDFHLCPCCMKSVDDKIYLAMDSPVHRESDSVSWKLHAFVNYDHLPIVDFLYHFTGLSFESSWS